MIWISHDSPTVAAQLRALLHMRKASHVFLLLAAMLFFGSSLSLAAESSEPSARDNEEDAAVAGDVNGKTFQGKPAAFDEDGVTLIDKTMQQFRLDRRELISLRFPARAAPPRLPRSMVFLENGDRLAVNPVTLDGETLAAKWLSFRDAPPLGVPIETVRGVFLNVPEIATVQRRARTELLDRRDSSDLLLLINDDRLTGELKGIDQNFVTLENGGKEARVESGRVRWIGCNQELISFPKSSEPAAILTLSDGSRITARALNMDAAGKLRIDAAYGGTFQLPVASVVAVLFLGDNKTYLSDLEPAEYEFTPFLSTQWPLRKDRAVDGGPLQLRGVEYVKGLGLHSRSRVRYRLDGAYRRFRAIAGIDDCAGGEGSVRFAVELDGRRVFESDELTGKDPPAPVGPIDVTGARELTLVIEFGKRADLLDRADWCEALLIR